MEELIGRLVKSKAGRDKGRLFLILQIIDEHYVFIADGDLRKIETPKKKKMKHLQLTNTVFTEFMQKKALGAPNLNAELRKMILSVANENE
ncbi:MAG: KOW domain-containing RNA-binding protein [Clostridia bacterium]